VLWNTTDGLLKEHKATITTSRVKEQSPRQNAIEGV